MIALTVSLGNWQLRRAAAKLAIQHQHEQAEAAAPVRLDPALPASEVAQLAGRRVTVRGWLEPGYDVFIDNRSHNGIAGFHLVTPLRIEGGARAAEPIQAPSQGQSRESSQARSQVPGARYILVLRGWVASDPRVRERLPELPVPAGPVELTGMAVQELPQSFELQRAAPPGPDDHIWQNLKIAAHAAWSGLPLEPLLIRETGPAVAGGVDFDDGLLRDWPQAGNDVGMHRGYAVQWYAMAATTAALWLWFVLIAPLRRRRRIFWKPTKK